MQPIPIVLLVDDFENNLEVISESLEVYMSIPACSRKIWMVFFFVTR